MKKYVWIAIFFLLLLLFSCGDDDTIVKPRLETGEPLAQVADLPDSLDLLSEDPNAQAAQAWATELFLAVWTQAGAAHAYLYPSRLNDWEQIEGGCWRSSYRYGLDSLKRGVYLACPLAHGHRWRFDNRQWCAVGVECAYYPVARGITGTAGKTGSFIVLSPYDSTKVMSSWEWFAAAESDSIHWDFYLGEKDPGRLMATMDWSIDEDGTRNWVWEWPADEKWEMQTDPDPSTGWLRDYLWNADAGVWRLAHVITWSSGHGRWDQYDTNGQIIESLSW
jgi:hypothetical protein